MVAPFMMQGCTFYHLHMLSLAFIPADFSPRKDEIAEWKVVLFYEEGDDFSSNVS